MVRNNRGVTFMEMMMVVAIVGIISLVGPKIMVQLVRFIQLHTAKIEIQRDARACLSIINRFLRQAQSSTVRIGQKSGQPPYSQISFTGIDDQDYIFYQSGNTLYQVATSTPMISRNLRFIAFTYPRSDDPSIVSVAVTMEKSTYEGGSKALELSIEKVRVMN
jgi:prepilin-type N-terminal cleavage/methylation domain-containing protein